MAMAPADPRNESDFKLTLSKEIHFMGTTTKMALGITFVIAVLLLLSFGEAMASGSMMSGGMFGSGSMGGIGWMWIPVLVVLVLGVVLALFIFRQK